MPCNYLKRCVVVGMVSSKELNVGRTGNFDPDSEMRIEDACRHLCLERPVDVEGFDDNFLEGINQIKLLAQTIPGNGQLGTLLTTLDGEECLKFEW